MLEMWKKIRFR